MEASAPRYSGQITTIITPDLSANSTKMCLIFYYHMLGKYMGNLDVFVDFFAPSRSVARCIFVLMITKFA